MIKRSHLGRDYMNKDCHLKISDWRVYMPKAFNFKVGNNSFPWCKKVFSRSMLMYIFMWLGGFKRTLLI
jgi:hypothetical protein